MPPTTRSELLRVNGVSISFAGRTVLDDVNFRIDEGEFTGLIGSNGSGKTTLLRIILGLQAPDQGDVTMHSRTISRRNRSIGYVPQKVLLDPDMPVRARDLVALGVDGGRFGVRRTKERNAAVEQVLVAVDAIHFADRRIGTLSGGEQQRVLIAHALIGQPQLLLLDEPLANLDPGSVYEIVDLLHMLSRNNGIAVLISAHEMNPLLPVMDRIVYVANAKVASGSTEEVVRPDVLTALYGHHVDVVRLHGRVLVVTGADDRHRPDVAAHPDVVLE